ncbi:OmpA family protein, partial [Oharaeibacter diazotrophicus]
RCGAGTRLRVTGAAPDAADPAAAASLATARAEAVVKFLADVGVDPSRLVAGAAQNPVAADAPAVAIVVEDAAP